LQTILFALKCLKNAYQSLPERLPEPTNSAEEAKNEPDPGLCIAAPQGVRHIYRRQRRGPTSGRPAEK